MISTLRKLLPAPAKRAARRVFDAADVALVQLFSVNRLMANIYYFALSRRFDREHFAVMRGRRAYHRSLRIMKNTSPLLRRNIHRLEKGLIMRPRRHVFAESYILETVRCYNRANNVPGYCRHELRWAHDVLEEYFNLIKDTPIIFRARSEYLEAGQYSAQLGGLGEGSFKPYHLQDCPDNEVSFEELTTLFLRRRSVRWYKQQHVPLSLIQKTVNAAALAPSACNRQPYRFVIVNDPDWAQKVAECAGGTAGYAYQLPAVIIVIGDLSAYPKERDRHLIYIDAALASMQLMLAAETLGLSTCPINWPDVERSERKLEALIELPDYERVIMLISIGYGDPERLVPFSQKKRDALITEVLSVE